ncbi:rhodanese-like domain-containing protein [Glycomyces sp. L485]|uniref:rhodanese-like domain-containing protein n=1 Tax=Glycomyces sp. L485 TaxID=2909235 RepID=UPI001F4BA3EC|nr:rhodanese-like domain-containing protein [Glycomyces sp. L485]MCH7229577.1 rhodanese-like domain-containing protein [Glycomyces sp. L485]
MPNEEPLHAFRAAHQRGETVVDVREEVEYTAGHVPGAVSIPLHRLAAQLDRVPPGRVHVVCASGNRSKVAAEMLRRAGRDAVSVAGGTAAWHHAGGTLALGRYAA